VGCVTPQAAFTKISQRGGRALSGAKGINLRMSTLQNRLADHGYVTTRVLVPLQWLKSGILTLVIIPGVVRHVRLTLDSDDYTRLYSSFARRLSAGFAGL